MTVQKSEDVGSSEARAGNSTFLMMPALGNPAPSSRISKIGKKKTIGLRRFRIDK